MSVLVHNEQVEAQSAKDTLHQSDRKIFLLRRVKEMVLKQILEEDGV